MRSSIWLIALLCISNVYASDIAREKRIASEIEDAILDGEPVYLPERSNTSHEFLTIYTEAEASRGAVLIMHGRGFHPDWADVANPLRVGLAEQGWNTLSIQMPVLKKEAKYNDYVEIFPEGFGRIESALDYLKQQGNEKIVMIAHSCSVHFINAWIKAGKLRDIDAFVGIGMGATDYRQPMVDEFQLSKIKVPVLDVYGKDDYPAVHRMAAERLRLIEQAGNSKSAQVVVPEANHYFTDKGDALLEVVGDWLNKL